MKEAGGSIHKGAAEGAVEQRRKKLVGKSSWFKGSPKQKTRVENTGKRRTGTGDADKPLTPVPVLFVPQTPQGALASKLKEKEVWLSMMQQEKTKIVERSGTTIRQLLIRSNPWGQGHCGRPEGECPPCDTGDGKQRCQARSVLYETSCLSCKEASDRAKQLGTENTENRAVYSIYVGETALTARERMVGVKGEGARGGGHLNDYEKGLEKSHMTKHWLNCHRGEEKPKFEVKIIKTFTSCMVRQIWEAIRIRRRLLEQGRGDVRLLNSRSEYNRCSLPRLVVEDSFEKAASDEDTEKEEARNSTEHDNEREPAAVRLNSKTKPSSGANSNSSKTSTHREQPADIRTYFKKQKDDKGVT